MIRPLHVMPPTYFSKYGGLWIDSSEFDQNLNKRAESGDLTKDEVEQVRFFAEKGYLILPGAVSSEACDRFSSDITAAWEHGDPRLLVQTPGESRGSYLTAGSPRVQARCVDSYVYYDSALDLLLSSTISRFLGIIFGDNPLLFQSLSFDMGSEQGMHQDTAYVVVSSPLELAASWIALEDVREGSGELMYIPGSHRIPEYHFSGSYKHWSQARDGNDQHEEWSRLLLEKSEKLGLKTELFRPRKGDVLIWAADLVHGGSPVKDRSLTRKSLVGHYCPNRVTPNYFFHLPDQTTKIRHPNGFYSSMYYPMR